MSSVGRAHNYLLMDTRLSVHDVGSGSRILAYVISVRSLGVLSVLALSSYWCMCFRERFGSSSNRLVEPNRIDSNFKFFTQLLQTSIFFLIFFF